MGGRLKRVRCEEPGCENMINPRTNKTKRCKHHCHKAGSRAFRDIRTGKPLPRIKRECLKCERPFMAIGRINRICPACTLRNSNVYAPALYGVVCYNEFPGRLEE